MSDERKLLRLPQVIERVGISKSGIYRRIKMGTFPAPFRLGEHASGWDSRAIDEFIDRIVASGPTL